MMVPAITGDAGAVPGVCGPDKAVAVPIPRELFARKAIEYCFPFSKPFMSNMLVDGVILTQIFG